MRKQEAIMAASASQIDALPPVAEWDTQVEVSNLVKYFSCSTLYVQRSYGSVELRLSVPGSLDSDSC